MVRETTGVYLFVLQKLVFSLARLRATSVGGKEKVRQVSNWILNALPTVQDTTGTKGGNGWGGVGVGWWGVVEGAKSFSRTRALILPIVSLGPHYALV